MKKFLLGFLMLVMLTPALACGAVMCTKKAQASQDMPCHEQPDESEKNTVMLFKDCSGIDLAQSDPGATLKKPDIVFDIAFGPVSDEAAYSYLPADAYYIRGPPDWTRMTATYPPVLQTTQRFRI